MAVKIFTRLTSIHGRRIAMSATGAIVDKNGFGAVMADASGVLQTTLKSIVETLSSSGAQAVAYGMSVFSSATATSRNFTLVAPSSGQGKEIFSLSSATTTVLETTTSDITFVTTGAESSALTWSAGGGIFGERIVLKGLSNTRWAITNKTAQVS